MKSTPKRKTVPFRVDIHSHFIPGIDDGSETMEQTIHMLRRMEEFGYQKVITTPHIIHDTYRNTPEIILEGVRKVQEAVKKESIPIRIEAAAEYYLDEFFMEKLANKSEKILSFGDDYVLIETSFINEPVFLEHAIFELQSQGYKPVLAHPERYLYFHNKKEELSRLKERGLLLQVNLNSLNGYYAKPASNIAAWIIENKMANFLGSDCHHDRHLDNIGKVINSKLFDKALDNPLLNTELI
ncbi:tyrosine-protein phosphatase [Roseivirga sp. BDSF3-8]|uniref:tyrosine-protein phosphatase n=1 Tax=Roseivirga sp. BDSF3-8 TaxID=3241598 RepID=UPI0035320BDB